jgi:hypothetical protein
MPIRASAKIYGGQTAGPAAKGGEGLLDVP